MASDSSFIHACMSFQLFRFGMEFEHDIRGGMAVRSSAPEKTSFF